MLLVHVVLLFILVGPRVQLRMLVVPVVLAGAAGAASVACAGGAYIAAAVCTCAYSIRPLAREVVLWPLLLTCWH